LKGHLKVFPGAYFARAENVSLASDLHNLPMIVAATLFCPIRNSRAKFTSVLINTVESDRI